MLDHEPEHSPDLVPSDPIESAHIAAQLLLAQLADSAFPSGAFAHSYGLEQSVRDGQIASPTDLVDFTYSVLCLAVAGSDAVVAARAAPPAPGGANAAINAVDHKLKPM